MYCTKCGAKIDDSSVFCSECGTKCQENFIQPAPNNSNAQTSVTNEQSRPAENAMRTNYPQEAASGANYAQQNPSPVQVSEENVSEPVIPTADVTPDEPIVLPPKKKKKFLKVLIPILAIIILLSVTVLAFGRTIFFAVAPEAYVSTLIKATSDELAEEWNQVEENVFGFDITMNEKMTAGVSVDFREDSYNEFTLSGALANDPKKEKILASGDFENNYGKGRGYAYIDNENMGVMLPGSDDKYLSAPSKDFGEQLSKSNEFAGEMFEDEFENNAGYDVIKGIDLSYESIKQMISSDNKTADKMKKHISKGLTGLLKKSEVGKREKTDYEFEDKNVRAYSISMTVNSGDFKDAYIETLKNIAADKSIKTTINFESIIDAIEDEFSDSDDSDYEIKLIEYKGKIVSVEIKYDSTYEYEGYDYEYDYDDSYTEKTENTIVIRTTNKDKLLNGITIENTELCSTDYDDEDRDNREKTDVDTMEFTSNWASEKVHGKITLNMTNSNDYVSKHSDGDKYTYNYDTTYDFEMDFDKKEWSLEFKYKSRDTPTLPDVHLTANVQKTMVSASS